MFKLWKWRHENQPELDVGEHTHSLATRTQSHSSQTTQTQSDLVRWGLVPGGETHRYRRIQPHLVQRVATDRGRRRFDGLARTECSNERLFHGLRWKCQSALEHRVRHGCFPIRSLPPEVYFVKDGRVTSPNLESNAVYGHVEAHWSLHKRRSRVSQAKIIKNICQITLNKQFCLVQFVEVY